MDDDADDDLLISISQAAEQSVAHQPPVRRLETTVPATGTPLFADDDDDVDDDVLNSISEAAEQVQVQTGGIAATVPTPRSPFRPHAVSTQSVAQLPLNTSGFLPRTRQTQTRRPPAPAPLAPNPMPVSVVPTAAARKRVHNLLNDSDDSDDDVDDRNGRHNSADADESGSNLFQFNAAAKQPKRTRLCEPQTEPHANDSQQIDASSAADGSQMPPPTQPTQSSRRIGASLSGGMRNRSSAAASRLLDMSAVRPVHISLLSGWMSRSSIKCEAATKLEDGATSETKSETGVDRKPRLTADGEVDETDGREDSKAWLEQLQCGFAVQVRRVQLVNRTAASNVGASTSRNESGGGKNFKAFAKVSCNLEVVVFKGL